MPAALIARSFGNVEYLPPVQMEFRDLLFQLFGPCAGSQVVNKKLISDAFKLFEIPLQFDELTLERCIHLLSPHPKSIGSRDLQRGATAPQTVPKFLRLVEQLLTIPATERRSAMPLFSTHLGPSCVGCGRTGDAGSAPWSAVDTGSDPASHDCKRSTIGGPQ